MASWKRKWKKELDMQIPTLDQNVLTVESETNGSTVVLKSKNHRKWWISLSALTAVAAIILSVVVGMNVLNPPPTNLTYSTFSVEINPSAVFVVDNNGKVVSVKSANSDADIIISNDDCVNQMVGKPMNQAVELFVDYSAKYGFINLEEDAAVRVSTADEKLTLDGVVDKVEEYLLSKGVKSVVFSNYVTEEDFSKIVGAEKVDVEDVKKLPLLFVERSLNDKNQDQINQEYYQTVILGNVKSYIESLVNIAEQKREKLTLIEEQSQKITEQCKSEDDLIILYDDYWFLKEFVLDSEYSTVSEELKGLCAQMELMLTEYQKTFGENIEKRYQLVVLNEKYSSLNFEEIRAFISDFEQKLSIIDAFILLLNDFDIDGDLILDLVSSPNSAEEYLMKLSKSYKCARQTLENENRLSYEQERKPVDKDENEKHLDSIKQNGSLNDYFDARKDKLPSSQKD